MRFRKLGLLNLLLREAMSPATLQRRAEPSAVMDSDESVDAFHVQGATEGALTPIYHFNALACSKRLRKHATLLDLGSGSGQFLGYLARCRPDVKIIGLDLSEKMVGLGKRILKDAGLETSVDLRIGDMTSFTRTIPEQIDLVTSVFALHHLPTSEALSRCLGEITQIRERCQCGIWIFDHARPNHPHTAEAFPEIFTPEASSRFKTDSCNSLIASFSFEELSGHLDHQSMGKFEHRRSRLINLYQAHWLDAQDGKIMVRGDWRGRTLSKKHRKECRQLCALFKDLP